MYTCARTPAECSGFGCASVKYGVIGAVVALVALAVVLIVVAVVCYRRGRDTGTGSRTGAGTNEEQITSVYPGYPLPKVCE